MNRWSWDRALAMTFALVLGLGLSLWPVHGGAMTTTIAADAAPVETGHCPGCETGEMAGAQLGTCQMVCAAATLPVVEAALLPSAADAGLRHDRLPLCGRISSLEPGPPKHPPSADA